jgi:hypothetical protein
LSKVWANVNSDKKSLVNARRDAGRQRRAEFNAGTQRSRDAEQRRGKIRYERTQGRREAETQSREEGRSDTSGEALRSIAFYKQTGDKRGAGKRARCSAVKTNTDIY